MRRAAMMATGLLLAGLWAGAQPVPQVMHYQGRLLDENAAPVPDGDYVLTLNLFAAATEGSLLWGPQIFGVGSEVPVVNGYFNLLLGPQDDGGRPLSEAFAGAECYLEATADLGGGDLVIAPRQRVLSVPYALRTQREAPFGAIMHFAGPKEGIPTGWLACEGQSLDRGEYPKLFEAIGTRWGNTTGEDFLLPNSLAMYMGGAAPGSGLSPPIIAGQMGPHSHGLSSHRHDSGSLYAEMAANRITNTVYTSTATAPADYSYDTYLSSITVDIIIPTRPPSFYENQGVRVGGETPAASGSSNQTGTAATDTESGPIMESAFTWFIIKAE